jgi:hypothetical protein
VYDLLLWLCSREALPRAPVRDRERGRGFFAWLLTAERLPTRAAAGPTDKGPGLWSLLLRGDSLPAARQRPRAQSRQGGFFAHLLSSEQLVPPATTGDDKESRDGS